MMFSFFNQIFRHTKKTPLGRWHNVGSNYNEKNFFLKEQSKRKREILKKYKIDPFSLIFSRKK